VTGRFTRDMRLGGILTAMVTPFDSKGDLDEDATARLIRHLLDNGSDGLVLAGSTGEGATMTDEEKVRLWEIGVAESGDAPIVAGTGTYDTRHSVELTERAHEVGVDAMLVVTPYYVRPNRRGIKAHYEAVAAATDRPIVAYNIPSRTATDMPNDLLAELAADIDNVTAVKQARYEDLAPIEGMDLLAGNDDVLAKVMDMGGTGGICVASNLIGTEMRRIVDEPEHRTEIEDALRDLYKAMSVTTNPIPVKAAMNMIGLEVGPVRLPLVEASEEEREVIREALERHNLLAAV
jgi:4-hydroxy-tetrahydrodipicolinate synthase